MNNTTLIGGAILLLALGALGYYGYEQATGANNSPTSTTTTQTTTNPPKVTIQEAGAPLVVTSSAIAASEFAVAVSGTVTPRGFATQYWFEYGSSPTSDTKTTAQNIGSGYVSLTAPAYITGLSSNTTYYIRLVAENQVGRTVGAQYSFKTSAVNKAPVGSLPSIRTTSSSNIARTSATLNGEVTPNQSTTQYWFEYGKTTDFGYASQAQSLNSASAKTAVSFAASNLSPATSYYYRLNAQNQWGTVNGVTLDFKTAGPVDTSRPSVDTNAASNVKSTSVTLRGKVNPNGVETAYWFEYSTDSLLGSVLLKTTSHKSAGNGSSYKSFDEGITGLSSGTNYFYRIVAESTAGIEYGDRVVFKTR